VGASSTFSVAVSIPQLLPAVRHRSLIGAPRQTPVATPNPLSVAYWSPSKKGNQGAAQALLLIAASADEVTMPHLSILILLVSCGRVCPPRTDAT
jgi:hypothetical protein